MRTRAMLSSLLLVLAVVLAGCTGTTEESSPDPGATTDEATEGETTESGGDDAQAAPGVSADTIKIGVHTPLTGPASFVGQGFELGAELAVQQINENGGVNGRTLELIVIDDEGTPDGASSSVRRLVERDEVFVVFGAGTSTATVPLLPYFDQNSEVPYYISLASDPQVTAEYRENVFSGATVPQAYMVETFSEYVLSQDLSSVAIFECDQGHCQAGVPLLEEALTEGGMEVTSIQQYNSGDTDFTGQVNSVMNEEPELVFIYGLAADAPRIINQLRQAGYDGRLIGDTSLSDPSVVEVAGEDAEGLVTFWLASTQFIDEETGAMAEWREAFDAAFPRAPEGTPNLYSLMAYSDTYVVAEGIRRAGDNPTRQAFIDGLEELDGFVAGAGDEWPAQPVGMPRSFEEGDHLGNTQVVPVIAQEGQFQAT